MELKDFYIGQKIYSVSHSVLSNLARLEPNTYYIKSLEFRSDTNTLTIRSSSMPTLDYVGTTIEFSIKEKRFISGSYFINLNEAKSEVLRIQKEKAQEEIRSKAHDLKNIIDKKDNLEKDINYLQTIIDQK